jgi:cysteine desulfurase/selenocysteine lyase
MDRLGIGSTTRASVAMYNTFEDIDALASALRSIIAQACSKGMVLPREAASGGDAVMYPLAASPSPQAAADQLADEFTVLEDRDSRSQYVIDLGERLPHYFDLLKQVSPRVQGCMSEVYIVGRRSANGEGKFEFVADANADIVRGLIALMEKLFSGQRAADVLAFDIEAFFQRIGLDQFISSQRRNGLAGLVQRIRSMASDVAGK